MSIDTIREYQTAVIRERGLPNYIPDAIIRLWELGDKKSALELLFGGRYETLRLHARIHMVGMLHVTITIEELRSIVMGAIWTCHNVGRNIELGEGAYLVLAMD